MSTGAKHVCGNWTEHREAEGGRDSRSPVTQRTHCWESPFVTFSRYLSYVPAFHEIVFSVSNLEVIILKSYMLCALSFRVFIIPLLIFGHGFSPIFSFYYGMVKYPLVLTLLPALYLCKAGSHSIAHRPGTHSL